MTSEPITVRSRWQSKRLAIRVTVKRVTLRTVSYIGVYGSISGTVPQWQFLQDFQPTPDRKKKRRAETP
jgi:hypothetical protein